MVDGSLRLLRLLPPLNWSHWYRWNIAESGVKHNKSIKSLNTVIVFTVAPHESSTRQSLLTLKVNWHLCKYSKSHNCRIKIYKWHSFLYRWPLFISPLPKQVKTWDMQTIIFTPPTFSLFPVSHDVNKIVTWADKLSLYSRFTNEKNPETRTWSVFMTTGFLARRVRP